MPKFFVEQIALAPPDPVAAKELLKAMGIGDWSEDIVVAKGHIGEMAERAQFGAHEKEKTENVAHLSFNYTALEKARELELLHYTAGKNWLDLDEGDPQVPCVSHFGMHINAEEISDWKDFFKRRKIKIIQEVTTLTHSNPAIAGQRWYHYIIFETRNILGTDIKLIVRRDA